MFKYFIMKTGYFTMSRQTKKNPKQKKHHNEVFDFMSAAEGE